MRFALRALYLPVASVFATAKSIISLYVMLPMPIASPPALRLALSATSADASNDVVSVSCASSVREVCIDFEITLRIWEIFSSV